jgi:hypothetical protein
MISNNTNNITGMVMLVFFCLSGFLLLRTNALCTSKFCRFGLTSRWSSQYYFTTVQNLNSGKTSLPSFLTVRPQMSSNDAETAEIQVIRQELATQYVRRVVGSTYEEAQRIVDEFLSDPDQSDQFIKMKREAKKDGLSDDLFIVGITLAIGVAHIIFGFYYLVSQHAVSVV